MEKDYALGGMGAQRGERCGMERGGARTRSHDSEPKWGDRSVVGERDAGGRAIRTASGRAGADGAGGQG